MKKSATKPATKPTEPTLKPGRWAAVVLKSGAAPLRCYVGQIQAIDTQGVRLTLIDWILGSATNWDFFVPHASLESVFVCTDQHDLTQFGDVAGKWQEAMKPKQEKAQAAAAEPKPSD